MRERGAERGGGGEEGEREGGYQKNRREDPRDRTLSTRHCSCTDDFDFFEALNRSSASFVSRGISRDT